jgi:hypothetical protein
MDGSAVVQERAVNRSFALRSMSAWTSSSKSAPAVHEIGIRRVHSAASSRRGSLPKPSDFRGTSFACKGHEVQLWSGYHGTFPATWLLYHDHTSELLGRGHYTDERSNHSLVLDRWRLPRHAHRLCSRAMCWQVQRNDFRDRLRSCLGPSRLSGLFRDLIAIAMRKAWHLQL